MFIDSQFVEQFTGFVFSLTPFAFSMCPIVIAISAIDKLNYLRTHFIIYSMKVFV